MRIIPYWAYGILQIQFSKRQPRLISVAPFSCLHVMLFDLRRRPFVAPSKIGGNAVKKGRKRGGRENSWNGFFFGLRKTREAFPDPPSFSWLQTLQTADDSEGQTLDNAIHSIYLDLRQSFLFGIKGKYVLRFFHRRDTHPGHQRWT